MVVVVIIVFAPIQIFWISRL